MIGKRRFKHPMVRQIWTLMQKNIRCLVRQHWLITLFVAFIIPVGLSVLFTSVKLHFLPPAQHGIGISRPIMSLRDAMNIAYGSGHDRLMLVDGPGGRGAKNKMSLVLNLTQAETESYRSPVQTIRISDEDELKTYCPGTLRGMTRCYGAVVMRNAPPTGPWQYTIKTDAVAAMAGVKIDVFNDRNFEQVFLLPLQRAVDKIIAGIEAGDGPNLLQKDVNELPFTSETQAEYERRRQDNYLNAIVNFMGVGFVTTIIWVTYHLAGVVAADRESGITRLIDAMMPGSRPSAAQATRIIAHHLSFSALYAPAWIVAGIIFRCGVFVHSSFFVILILQLLGGLGTVSFTILCASFFGRSQLSSAAAAIGTLLLAILAQSVTYPSTTIVALLSALFTPCNYVYFITLMARFERAERATHLTEAAPGESPWNLPGLFLWLMLALQIVIYPLLAAWVERWRFGTPADGRRLAQAVRHLDDDVAVKIDGLTKVYYPALLSRLGALLCCGGGSGQTTEPIVAVNGLSLSCPRGQIVTLLGANGSGKSTTLNAIAGLLQPTSGSVIVDGRRGLGIAPQKNVLWDDVSVEDHLKIFGRLKSPVQLPTAEETAELIKAVDLWPKRRALAKTLSGGQKRKLQLGMMLAGGSAVCCVDEVSSGLDPISRRKIWDILLAERGRRTLILTTHFLDEADLLADHIAVLSRGTLRAAGSSAELKERFGGGYHVRIPADRGSEMAPEIEGVDRKVASDGTTYEARTSDLAARAIQQLDAGGIDNYHFSSPNIEDVFLRLVEEVEAEQEAARPDTKEGVKTDGISQSDGPPQPPLELMDGTDVGNARQMSVLFRKRVTVLKRNWMPYAVAVCLPLLAAALTSLYVRQSAPLLCSAKTSGSGNKPQGQMWSDDHKPLFLVGPNETGQETELSRILPPIFQRMNMTLKPSSGGSGNASNYSSLYKKVNTYDDFTRSVHDDRKKLVTGIWLGNENQTMAWWANKFITSSLMAQQIFNSLRLKTPILADWAAFDEPFHLGLGSVINLVIYMSAALIFLPAFFGLYPSSERQSGVRALQYSNGVRPLPLWTAYLAFDLVFILAVAGLTTGIWVAMADRWYHIGYMLIVTALYGMASTIFSYLVSLYARSPVGSFGLSATIQGIFFLAYLLAYLSVLRYVPTDRVDRALVVCHFLLASLTPIGSLVRSLFIVTNLLATACETKAQKFSARPASLLVYGGPMLYLALQSIAFFGLLVWLDSGRRFREGRLRGRRKDDGGRGIASVDGVVEEEEEEERVTVTAAEKKEEAAAAAAEVVVVKKGGGGGGGGIDGSGGGGPGGVGPKCGADPEKDDGLRVMNLTKSFGRNTAVDNVSFAVRKGEIFALLGPNGAGKSTTMALIRGDQRPSRNGGDVLVGDISVTRNRAAARSRLGVCPQIDALDAYMTVREHLDFYARVRGVPDFGHNVSAVLDAVRLQGLASRMAMDLSGGNRRKLNLAIALMGNPDVVLLDEPSSGLDAAAKRVLWPILSAAAAGRCILLTTHSLEEADALASRAGILARRMLAVGSLDELRSRAGHRLYVHLVAASAPRTPVSHMARIATWVRVAMPDAEVEPGTYHGQMRALGRLVVLLQRHKAALGVEHYSVSPTTLDQVFLSIVGGEGDLDDRGGGG
ncbi:hypothetical protein CP532_4807 [Ophiocordyceps camponoti-leonardi (nom. inval.)]|nr:hypothetical protein CP532_4807 [Ophiocordyceps camponoti-leonardi (nom. inval.)]